MFQAEYHDKRSELLPTFLFLKKTVVIPVLLRIIEQFGEFSMVLYKSKSLPSPLKRPLRVSVKSKLEVLLVKYSSTLNLTKIEDMAQQIIHPMVKLQHHVRSLVESKVIKPTDSIWKIALLYGNEWSYWKQELAEYGFTTQDPLGELLAVEAWDEE